MWCGIIFVSLDSKMKSVYIVCNDEYKSYYNILYCGYFIGYEALETYIRGFYGIGTIMDMIEKELAYIKAIPNEHTYCSDIYGDNSTILYYIHRIDVDEEDLEQDMLYIHMHKDDNLDCFVEAWTIMPEDYLDREQCWDLKVIEDLRAGSRAVLVLE